MPKMIQIRNVPNELHKALKVRAAQAGMSLSEYLLRQLADHAGRPTRQEVIDRIRSDTPVKLSKPAAEWVREIRGD